LFGQFVVGLSLFVDSCAQCFYVSMLGQHVPDPLLIVDFEPLQLIEGLGFEEKPMSILVLSRRRCVEVRSVGKSLVKESEFGGGRS